MHIHISSHSKNRSIKCDAIFVGPRYLLNKAMWYKSNTNAVIMLHNSKQIQSNYHPEDILILVCKMLHD